MKFGEVVRLGRERCDPATEGIERYIGLEHIEPGDLRVRSWGDVSAGTTFTTRVRPGHVLFGKRRAYQRKVAVADFDAVCSGDIYVFESANPAKLLPELLPFLCQTDAFFEYAVGTSAGSLSPRTNWTSLADYEFALPPLEEQRRIAARLRASSACVDELRVLAVKVRRLQDSALASLLALPDSRRRLSELCSDTITYGIVQAGPNVSDGIPYIRVTDMTAGDELSARGMLRTSHDIAGQYARSTVRTGDIVVALRGVAGRVMTVPAELDGANLTQGTARVRIAPEHNATFVLWALRSDHGRREFRKFLRGWKGEALLEITLGDLRDVSIPVPTRATQDRIARIARHLDEAVRGVDGRLASAMALHRELLSGTMAGG